MQVRIGQFTDTFLPVVDGVGRVVSHYASLMGELCEACYVIAPRHPQAPQGKVPYEVVDFKAITLPKVHQYRVGLPKLDGPYRRKLAGIQLDIVHAHSPFMAGREAYRVSRKRNLPLVATFHSKYYDDFYQFTKSKTLSKLGIGYVVDFFSKCDQVWAVSHSTAEVLRSYGYRGSIEVVENGTDVKEPNWEAARKVESLYGLGPFPMLLFVGQMNWKKNIRRILEAVGTLVRDGRELRLVMAGQGPSEQEIRSLASSLGLDQVVVFPGHVTEGWVLEGLYTRADLFVFPSFYDNAPMVVREAAAVGTPSLLALGSSAAEIIKDGYNGLLAEDDTPATAAKIAWALDHLDELRHIGATARKTIPKPWKEIVSDALVRYEDLIRAKRQGR